MDPLRPVCTTDKYTGAVREGWHHMFYTDTGGELYALIEDRDGAIRCRNLDYYEYRFTDREHVGERQENRDA